MTTSARHARSIPFGYAAEATPPPMAANPPAWFQALRQSAKTRAVEHGLPSARTEAWKYTNLAPLAKRRFDDADTGSSVASSAPAAESGLEGPCLSFVNGRLCPALSRLDDLPDGLRVMGLAQALSEDPAWVEASLGSTVALNGNALAALNTAFTGDGCLIHAAADAAPAAPIHLRFISQGEDAARAYHPRIVITAEPGSALSVVETHEGASEREDWSNPVTEVRVAENARVRHVKLQAEAAQAIHTALTVAEVGRAGRYESMVLTVGAALSRNEIHVALAGEGAECALNGGYMIRGTQHADTTTVIDHAVPHCASREVYKGVLDDRAHGVFQGKIIVQRDAQRSDGHQLNRALLLSKQAEVNSKPELEIYADDVACSHGATTGDLDPDQLFYLRARGIDRAAAAALLVEGFMGEVLEAVPAGPERDLLIRRVAAWIDARSTDA